MRIINNILEDVNIADLTLGRLVIPEGVLKIAEGSLTKVANLVREIYVANSVKEIENRAFKGFSKLYHVNLGEGVEVLGEEVFSNCSNLSHSKLPNTIKSVGQRLYFNCRNLESVELGKNMQIINDFMFANSKKLKTVTVPSVVEFIGDFAFYNSGLQTIFFEEHSKLKQVGDSSFANCSRLRSCKLPNSVLSIKGSAFANSAIANFVVPESVKEVSASTFNECKKLKHLVISKNVNNAHVKLNATTAVSIMLGNGKRVRLNENTLTTSTDNVNASKDGEFNVVRINSKHDFKVIYFNNDVFVFDKNEIKQINYKELINTRNFNLLLEQNKMDSYYYWNRKLQQTYGKNILNPPSADEVLAIPESYIDNYIAARKIFNSFYSKIKYNKPTEVTGLIKLAISVGLLESNPNVRNEAYTFLNDYIINGNKINKEHYPSLNYINIKEEFTFNNKIIDLLKDVITKTENNNVNLSFIAETINNFEKIIEFKRVPNYEFVKEFFKFNKYDNVKPETEELAQIASSFVLSNNVFNIMSELHVKAKHNKIKGLIDLLEDMNGNQAQKESDLHNLLVDKLDADYTFEWLKKDSPYTPMLAYITDSCAKPGSNANSIFVDSILKENVQNLVIRNNNNTIIAKSTAHLDIKEQVLLFNNVEINHNFINRASENKKENVYQAYMRGVEVMVTIFNEKAKELNKPEIKRVCVGATITNDLGSVISKYHELAFGSKVYSYKVFDGYIGDSSSQYVLWEKDLTNNLDAKHAVKTK